MTKKRRQPKKRILAKESEKFGKTLLQQAMRTESISQLFLVQKFCASCGVITRRDAHQGLFTNQLKDIGSPFELRALLFCSPNQQTAEQSHTKGTPFIAGLCRNYYQHDHFFHAVQKNLSCSYELHYPNIILYIWLSDWSLGRLSKLKTMGPMVFTVAIGCNNIALLN